MKGNQTIVVADNSDASFAGKKKGLLRFPSKSATSKGQRSRSAAYCQTPSINKLDQTVVQDWLKPNRIVILMSLMDVSYLFKPEAKNAVKTKFANNSEGFTLRNRGDSMKRLT